MTTYIALAPDPNQRDVSYFICITGEQASSILEFRVQSVIDKDVTLYNIPVFILDSAIIEVARTGMLTKAHMTMKCKIGRDGFHTCTKSDRAFDKDIVVSISPNNRMYVSKTFPSGSYKLKQSLPVIEEIPIQVKICLVQISGPNISPALLPRVKPAHIPGLCADKKADPTPSTSSAHTSKVDKIQVSSGSTIEEPIAVDNFSPLVLCTGGNPEDIVDIPKMDTKRGPGRPSAKGKSSTGVGKSSVPRKLKISHPDMGKDLRLTIDLSRATATFTLDPTIANNDNGELTIRLDTLNSSWSGAGSGFLMDPTPPVPAEDAMNTKSPKMKRKQSIAPWPRKKSLVQIANNNDANNDNGELTIRLDTLNSSWSGAGSGFLMDPTAPVPAEDAMHTKRPKMTRKQSIAPWPRKKSLVQIANNNEDNIIEHPHQTSPTDNLPKGWNETSNPPLDSIPFSAVDKEKFWCKDTITEWMSSNHAPDSPDSTTNNNQDLSVYTKSLTTTDKDDNILLDHGSVPATLKQMKPHDNINTLDTMIIPPTQNATKIQIETHHCSNNNSNRNTSGPKMPGTQTSPAHSFSTNVSTPRHGQESETLLGPGNSTDQYFCDVSDQFNSPARPSPSPNSSAVTLNDSDVALLKAIKSIQRHGTSVIFPASKASYSNNK